MTPGVRAHCDRCGKALSLYGRPALTEPGKAFTWGNAPMRCECGGTYRGRRAR